MFFFMIALCSYHSPCFPGTCADTVTCQCHDGFSGLIGNQRCRTSKKNAVRGIVS